MLIKEVVLVGSQRLIQTYKFWVLCSYVGVCVYVGNCKMNEPRSMSLKTHFMDVLYKAINLSQVMSADN